MEYISKPSFNGNFDKYIFKSKKNLFIKELRSKVAETLKVERLEEIHKKISPKQLNEARIEAFKSINLIDNWKKKLLELITPEIHEIFGLDLAIQKKLNLSIQMPEDENSVLEKHTDFRSGDSPFQRVIWIPLTDSFDSNAMFMENELGNYEPVKVNFGEFLIFDPNTNHGNIVNKTKKTRVSVNIRVKNWFSPDFSDEAPDRQFGVFYEDLCLSESTLRTFKILSNGSIK